jgi:glycosyltransferase involved in cell wall biosynthesis
MVRVAIAHDWLVRYAGSERVVEQLLEAFPGSRLLTTFLDAGSLPDALGVAEPSFLDRLPTARDHHEWFLGLMPLAWRLREPIADVDVVIASSHACANSVRIRPGIPLVSYCHTPMRYAWDFEAESERFPRPTRPVARLAMGAFRRWDRRVAMRVTRFVANSNAVAARIQRFYGLPSQVVFPPARTEFFTPGGERGGRFLYVGRLTGYKRPDLVVEAFRDLPFELDVVGEGALLSRLQSIATPNVRFLGTVSDDALRDLYRAAVALVYPVDEDFGIGMAEAQACGTPVVALAAGGALDIIEDGVTGMLLQRQDVGELRRAIHVVAATEYSTETIRSGAERFSEDRFRHEMQAIATEVAM